MACGYYTMGDIFKNTNTPCYRPLSKWISESLFANAELIFKMNGK